MPWRVGIDENGLGPQLGPMIVTAVMARVGMTANRRLQAGGGGYLHERLGDSKALVDCHDVALGEAWARAVRGLEGPAPQSPRELFDGLSLRSRRELQARCPTQALQQCWGEAGEQFEASDEQLRQASRDLRALQRRGVEVVWARSMVLCVRQLNEARRAGIGRFHADLHAMEELILAARGSADEDPWFVCGKVGGLQRYVPAFSKLGDRLHVVLAERREESVYRFPGVGTVSFVRDADGDDPLVALASLIGKYLRELTMRRIVRHYRGRDPELEEASGYNDPVTGRFVKATRKLRKLLSVPDECFRREQAGDET